MQCPNTPMPQRNVNLLGYTTREPHNAQRRHQSEDGIHVRRHDVHHLDFGSVVDISLRRHYREGHFFFFYFLTTGARLWSLFNEALV